MSDRPSKADVSSEASGARPSRVDSRTIEDVACTQCGCVCDDLAFVVENDGIVDSRGACGLAKPFYEAVGRTSGDSAYIDGRAVSFDAAIERAIELLGQAQAPIFYGLSRSSTAGQRAAIALADAIGGTIDTTASLCHGPSIIALQQTGESTSSLGEVRNRCDLVVFWRSDPLVTHPRHLERYSAMPAGQFVPRGRQDRTIVVVDGQRTTTADEADVFVPLEADRDFDALWTLRLLVAGTALAAGAETGAPLEALQGLAHRMKSCHSGVVFYGSGLSSRPLGHCNVGALFNLATDLNAYTRFYAHHMGVSGALTGADDVLCWQTGYPFAVNLTRGYPRSNPGEYSLDAVLERRETDLCVVVGSETLHRLSWAALEHLQRIPTIVFDYPQVESIVRPTVRFTTAVYGVHAPGTASRMDDVPIPLKAFLPRRNPTDDEILEALLDGLRANGRLQPV
jgi:formylmethanofuran dehydrogenase subunit B